MFIALVVKRPRARARQVRDSDHEPGREILMNAHAPTADLSLPMRFLAVGLGTLAVLTLVYPYPGTGRAGARHHAGARRARALLKVARRARMMHDGGAHRRCSG
jgi:hypothetical protein